MKKLDMLHDLCVDICYGIDYNLDDIKNFCKNNSIQLLKEMKKDIDGLNEAIFGATMNNRPEIVKYLVKRYKKYIDLDRIKISFKNLGIERGIDFIEEIKQH